MIPVRGTIEDLIEVLDDVRREIPAKKTWQKKKLGHGLKTEPMGFWR